MKVIEPGGYLDDKGCEETTGMVGDSYLRCGAPAVALISFDGRSEGPYFMCRFCANHAVHNRRGRAQLVLAGYESWVE